MEPRPYSYPFILSHISIILYIETLWQSLSENILVKIPMTFQGHFKGSGVESLNTALSLLLPGISMGLQGAAARRSAYLGLCLCLFGYLQM